MHVVSSVMVRLLRAQPFESEPLDQLAEKIHATSILKRDKLKRYFKSALLPVSCLAYSDAIVFNSNFYDALLPQEVLAVGAHEFNHMKMSHVTKRLPRTVLPALILAASFGYFCWVNTHADKGLFTALTAILSFLLFEVASIYVNAGWFRAQETQCDLSALEFVDGEAVISVLAKLRPLRTSKWMNGLSKILPHTHPSIDQRIKNAQEAMNRKSNQSPLAGHEN